jgi:spermidine synthase
MVREADIEKAGGVMGLVLACFFFSGMTSLVYEILWTRMIVTVIGAGPLAVSIILAVFMGGLGVGSYLAGRRIDRIKEGAKLLRLYGLLEFVIGGYCFVLPWLLVLFKPIYAFVYNRLFEHFLVYNLITFLGCGILLFVPVVCMGATLPILCRFYVTRKSQLSGHIGRLYGLNTIGAAFGAFFCGFWMIEHLGSGGSLSFAVAVNGVIGFVCIIASYSTSPRLRRTGKLRLPTAEQRGVEGVEQAIPKEAAYSGVTGRMVLIIFAVSGFCSMAYEVIWTKLLGLLIGPTTYSFTIVLVTFICGLGLGSIIFGWLGQRKGNVMKLLLYTQILASISALLLSQFLGNSQFFFAKLIYHFHGSFFMLNMVKGSVLFCLLLVPALCLGAAFPLVGKIYTCSLSRIGKSLGSAYAVNTAGAVLGAIAAGLILVPLVGKEMGLRIVFSIQIVTVLLVSVRLLVLKRERVLEWFPVLATVLSAGLLCFYYPSWDRENLSLGQYQRIDDIKETLERSGWVQSVFMGPSILRESQDSRVVYYGDGIGGFTTVLEFEDVFGKRKYTLVNSGKPDASSRGDMPTQVLCAHFPMLFHEGPKSVMVLGFGSGITAAEVLCYPVERLDILEISEEVIKAGEFFAPWNREVVSDGRSNLIIQDGRAHLALTDRKYDVIISEPSNPWMAGLASLFTRDCFELGRERLNENGIFVQFIHSYQMDWETFSLVGRSFSDVFSNSLLISTQGGDYYFVGINGDKGLDLETAGKRLGYAQKSTNMTLLDARLLYRFVQCEDLAGLFGAGDLNTDEAPLLEFSAPRRMYVYSSQIEERIKDRAFLKPVTREIVSQMRGDIDSQLDYMALAFSLNKLFDKAPDLTGASVEQKERFAGLVKDFCSDHKFKHSLLKDIELQRECRLIQIDAIKEAVGSLRDKALAYHTIADLYYGNEQFADAEGYYLKALELKPDHGPLLDDLADVLFLQGKIEQAISYYKRALELDPGLLEARENLNRALSGAG